MSRKQPNPGPPKGERPAPPPAPPPTNVKRIYILLVTHPYEYSECLGVYDNKKLAGKRKTEAVKMDRSYGYDEFEVLEFEINAELAKT